MQVNLILPDGSQRSYAHGTTGLEIAESIGKKLAKDAVAIRVNGDLKDLTLPLEKDAEIEELKNEIEILKAKVQQLLDAANTQNESGE